jgi:hypothetical protein
MTKASHVAPIAGMTEASALPTMISAVEVGVASSGSSERVDFSPTMLYECDGHRHRQRDEQEQQQN